MIESYKNDDSAYTRWTIDHHGRGFVLHRVRAGEFTIHVAGCEHIYDDAPSWNMTAREKICGDTEAELRRYAQSQWGAPWRLQRLLLEIER